MTSTSSHTAVMKVVFLIGQKSHSLSGSCTTAGRQKRWTKKMMIGGWDPETDTVCRIIMSLYFAIVWGTILVSCLCHLEVLFSFAFRFTLMSRRCLLFLCLPDKKAESIRKLIKCSFDLIDVSDVSYSLSLCFSALMLRISLYVHMITTYNTYALSFNFTCGVIRSFYFLPTFLP